MKELILLQLLKQYSNGKMIYRKIKQIKMKNK
jgi:hypothetical protein